MKQIPPLNGLRAFDAAGRHLNFRAAADEMGVTQGAVAQQVRQLEAHLGMPLFERVPKGLAFTPNGRSYHARIASAFEDLRSATETLRPEPGKVLVSITPTFAAKWLIPNLPEFSAIHPKIDLGIIATEKVSSFHSDGIDLAVRQAHPPFGAALQADLLFRQRVIAVAAPSLVGAHGPPPGPETLRHLPKLHDAHGLWPAFLGMLGVTDKGGAGLRLSQTALAIDAALSGQGVALVSDFLVQRDIAAGRLIQMTPAVLEGGRDFYLLSRRGMKCGPTARAVRDWIRSKAAAAPVAPLKRTEPR